jgi:hypothetical protein
MRCYGKRWSDCSVMGTGLRACRGLFLRGECARGLNQPRQARAWYEASLRLLQQLRLQREVPLEERSRYLARFREMVSAIVDFYVAVGDVPGAFRVCQQGKGSILRPDGAHPSWEDKLSHPPLHRA